MAGYFTRLSLVLSQGEQINRVLLIEPTTTAWLYQEDSNHRAQLNEIGSKFQQIVLSLERAQVEYDIGCEDIMVRHGSVGGARLKVGKRRYETVVLPPLTENLNAKTMELLEAYLEAGGVVICCGSPPALLDGRPSERGRKASRHSGWNRSEPAALPKMLLTRSKNSFAILRDQDDSGNLFHHRRRLDDGEFLFLANTSITAPSSGVIESTARGLEKWNLETGNISAYPFTKAEHCIKADFQLAPCGSLLLFLGSHFAEGSQNGVPLTKKSREPGIPESKATVAISPEGPLKIHRLEHNVLTLDYVDVTAGGETKKNIYFYRASQFVFAKNGMGRNPWDRAVQFRDELIKKKFAADSGFMATYRFTIEKQVPDSLYVVIERPDLYSVKCNGIAVSATENLWWLDKSFGKLNIKTAARVGGNAITVQASPFTIYHELEPAYVLGDFALKAADSGFVIVPEQKLDIEAGWNQQGYPFYAAGVSYMQTFEVPQPTGRYQVQLPHWYGSVAEIIVNGKPADYIGYQPWQCDVTALVKPGTNTVEIIIIGTLKNTLGPHHAGSAVGAAWPNMFQRAPETGPPAGNKYHTIGYGLFQPFVLKNTIKQAVR